MEWKNGGTEEGIYGVVCAHGVVACELRCEGGLSDIDAYAERL